MGDTADTATTEQARHRALPRTGEALYRYSAPVGTAGEEEPMRHLYPLTSICECGKTVLRATPDEQWGHKQW